VFRQLPVVAARQINRKCCGMSIIENILCGLKRPAKLTAKDIPYQGEGFDR
jgi:hypothetical protein